MRVLSLDPLLKMLIDYLVCLVVLTHNLRLVSKISQPESCHTNVADSSQLGPQIFVRYLRLQQLVQIVLNPFEMVRLEHVFTFSLYSF